MKVGSWGSGEAGDEGDREDKEDKEERELRESRPTEEAEGEKPRTSDRTTQLYCAVARRNRSGRYARGYLGHWSRVLQHKSAPLSTDN